MSRFARLALTSCATVIGFMAAGIIRLAVPDSASDDADRQHVERVRLPHHVPPRAGGASFRFAMAHDVLHERYPKHGPAYYRERERLTRAKYEKLAPDVQYALAQLDDIAVCRSNLGRPDEAIEIMRDKLARQKAAGAPEKEMYSSFANLGTFLTYANLEKAMAGDAEAKQRYREGVEMIQKGVSVNPDAHFGREKWQAAFAEFLLAAIEKPALLQEFDFLGNRLDVGTIVALNTYGKAAKSGFGHANYDIHDLFRENADLENRSQWDSLKRIRNHISEVGAERSWDQISIKSHRNPVAFDEPMIAVVTLWRQGDGANPYFALAIGETMLRVGQRFIAWTAFERASRMAGHYSPDLTTQQFLKDHCSKRQRDIEDMLRSPGQFSEAHPPDAEAAQKLRPTFNRELVYGEAYQQAYQEYEAKKIAAGVSIDDEKFYDEFNAGREPIASRPGPEEWQVTVSPWQRSVFHLQRAFAWGVLSAGAAAIVASFLLRFVAAPSRSTENTASPDSPV